MNTFESPKGGGTKVRGQRVARNGKPAVSHSNGEADR